METLRTPPPDRLPGDFTERVVRKACAGSLGREAVSRRGDLVRVLALAATAVSLFIVVPEIFRLSGAVGEAARRPAVELAAFFVRSAGIFFESLAGLVRALDGSGAILFRSIFLALLSAGVAVWGFREILGFLRE
jgi:hypothetical protein